MNERIGELLVQKNLISSDQLKKAQDEARQKGERIGHQITKLGYLEESELTDFVAQQYGVPSIDLGDFEIDADVIRLITPALSAHPAHGRNGALANGVSSREAIVPRFV